MNTFSYDDSALGVLELFKDQTKIKYHQHWAVPEKELHEWLLFTFEYAHGHKHDRWRVYKVNTKSETVVDVANPIAVLDAAAPCGLRTFYTKRLDTAPAQAQDYCIFKYVAG